MLRVTSNGLVTVALCLALTLRFFPRVSSIVVFGWMPLSREGSSIGNREWRSCVTRIIRSRRSIPIEELFRVTGSRTIAKKKNYLKSERREYWGEFTLEFLEIFLSCNYGIWNFQRKNRFFTFYILVWNIRKFVGDLISNYGIVEML